MSFTIHNNKTSTPPRGMLAAFKRELKAQRHSEETLTQLKQGDLNFFHGLFVSATENILRSAGSVFAVLTTALLGINLFKGSNSEDSFFNSWKLLGLLMLGFAVPFTADYTLEAEQKQSSAPLIAPIQQPDAVPVEQTNNNKPVEPETIICNVFKKLDFLSKPVIIYNWFEYMNRKEEYMNELKSRGLEVVEIGEDELRRTEYFQSFPQSPEEINSQTFSLDGRQVLGGLRIKLNGFHDLSFKEALADRATPRFYRSPGLKKLEVEIVTKDLDTGEIKLYKEPYLISLDDLCSKKMVNFLPNKKKHYPSGSIA